MHRARTLATDRPTERDVNSWVQSVEENMSSLSGLSIDNSPNLNELVDDKEIATRSVAFVVNSTRKGIVPLCADVANLFKTKYSLERKIHELRRDNNVLKSSLSSSVASSPTNFSQPAFLHHNLPLSRSCSRCSQCSSTASIPIPHHSPNLHVPRVPRSKASPIPHVASDQPIVRKCSIECDSTDHVDKTRNGTIDVSKEFIDDWNPCYLPMIVSQPNRDVQKISPLTYCSTKETPSPETLDIHVQYQAAHQLNRQLSDELLSAKSEIEALKLRLAQLERPTSREKLIGPEHNTTDSPLNYSSQTNTPSPSLHFINECLPSDLESPQIVNTRSNSPPETSRLNNKYATAVKIDLNPDSDAILENWDIVEKSNKNNTDTAEYQELDDILLDSRGYDKRISGEIFETSLTES